MIGNMLSKTPRAEMSKSKRVRRKILCDHSRRSTPGNVVSSPSHKDQRKKNIIYLQLSAFWMNGGRVVGVAGRGWFELSVDSYRTNSRKA